MRLLLVAKSIRVQRSTWTGFVQNCSDTHPLTTMTTTTREQQITLRPTGRPDGPETFEEIVAEAAQVAAEELDAIRDLATNGTRRIIESVGSLGARIETLEERFDKFEELSAMRHAELLRAIRGTA